ncbi:hypothetical protein GCM10011572_51610 [Pseudoduganella buxea]|uniref:Uncharacterized protein n=1 Tax=Pseudoduganella buxea TaxID=1949069 RepID=A0ABQ1LFA3_9BURK|nr:hypothetical protein GCM10011572_51610 [Pseudoduganella buxea]
MSAETPNSLIENLSVSDAKAIAALFSIYLNHPTTLSETPIRQWRVKGVHEWTDAVDDEDWNEICLNTSIFETRILYANRNLECELRRWVEYDGLPPPAFMEALIKLRSVFASTAAQVPPTPDSSKIPSISLSSTLLMQADRAV